MDLNASLSNIFTSNCINCSEDATELLENQEWESLDESLMRPYLVFIFLSSLSIATVVGNGLVILSVWREVVLHSPTNFFIASLACADLLVGAVVIPFEALTELLRHQWLFGEMWCDFWRAFDVLLATSSILNLSVISLDRYWAITEPFSYPSKMTPVTAGKMILGVWCCSIMISFPAIIYWRWMRVEPIPPERCWFTDDPLYLILSSSISFYFPLAVMLYTYFRIYQAAIRQTRGIQMGAKFYYDKELELKLKMRIHRGGGGSGPGTPPILRSQIKPSRLSSPTIELLRPLSWNGIRNNSLKEPKPASSVRRPSPTETDKQQSFVKSRGLLVRRKLSRFSKEKKAAQTLFFVLGLFLLCWLPFFIMNVMTGLCSSCGFQDTLMFSLFTWLGWLNSAMNPAVYAARNPDFRRAFGKILCDHCYAETFIRSRNTTIRR